MGVVDIRKSTTTKLYKLDFFALTLGLKAVDWINSPSPGEM